MKRGLISEFGGMVLWAIILVVIVVSAGIAITKITTSNQENQAKSTLDRFANFLSDIEEGKSESFIIFSPKGLYFVPSGSLVCICDKSDCNGKIKVCKTISKPIIYDGAFIKINLGTFQVANNKEIYGLMFNRVQESESYVNVGPECSGELVSVQGFQITSSVKPIFDKAADIAKKNGYDLRITSAYRTEEEQEYLWENRGANPVCEPAPGKTCPHQTGCAIDVCIGSLCEKEDPLGTFVSPETILLKQIMIEAGFVRLNSEYWHFEYGTDGWQTCKVQGIMPC